MAKGFVFRSTISVTSLALLATGVVGCSSEGRRNDADEVVVTTQAMSGGEAQDLLRYRVTGVITKEQRTAIGRAGAAIDEVAEDYILITARESVAESVRRMGFVVDQLVQSGGFPSADEAYSDYAEMTAEVNAIAAAHSNIVSVFSIGKTYLGKSLLVAKVSGNVTASEREPGVLFLGGTHAREHISVEMTLDLLRMLAEGYGTDPRIKNLVDSREIYIALNVNPDGSEFDIEAGYYRDWRKNRQTEGEFGEISNGIDLNRNFGYNWGCCNGSSTEPNDPTFRGRYAFSASETNAIKKFMAAHVVNGVQQIKTAISFHSYGRLILWPYGYTYDDVPSDMSQDDHDVFVTMGQAMAASNGYRPKQASDVYITDGIIDDWAYGTYGTFLFTFEMAGDGFYPAGSQIGALTSVNREAALYLIENAACPYQVIGKDAQRCSHTKQASSVFSTSRNHAELFRREADGYLGYFFADPTWTKDTQSFRDARVAGDISAVYSDARQHSEVFFHGDDGLLHYYFVPTSDPTHWYHDGVHFAPAGKISGHVSAVYSPERAHSEVFLRGEDRRLHFFFASGGTWQHDGSGAGGGEIVQGDISAVYSPVRKHSEAYYVGQNSRLHFAFAENGKWYQDRDSFAEAGTITGPVSAVYSPLHNHSEVFVRGADGQLHYFFVKDGSWAHDGIHFAPAGQIGEEITAVYSTARNHSEVFVTGADGRLHYFFVTNGTWQHDIIASESTPVGSSLTALFAPQRNHSEVFFSGLDGGTHYYYLNNGGWAHDGGSFR